MTQSSKRWLGPVLTLVIASACTTGGDASKPEVGAAEASSAEQPVPEQPVPEQPVPEAPVATAVELSVASVQMIQDCPDTEPTINEQSQPASSSSSAPKRGRGVSKPGQGRSIRQPCTQSTVQLALANNGEEPIAVEIAAVRILSQGKVVGTLAPRKPKIWTNNSYAAWDQIVAPGVPSKVSYKLSLPDWSEVETAIGVSSFGHMFTLELDVSIDGQVQTVSSPEFPREKPHVIVT